MDFRGIVNRVQTGVATAGERLVNAWSGRADGLQRWPPAEDEDRLRRYETCRNLYRGEHETVYVRRGGYSYDDERPYITVNLAGEITDLMVDRLFGNMPKITGPQATPTAENSAPAPDPVAEWIDGLISRSNLHSLLIRLGSGTSYRGDGALKVRQDKSGRPTISTVSPSCLFLKTDPDDTEIITQATIGYVKWRDKQAYLFQEIQTPGLIEWALYELRTGGASRSYTYNPEHDRVPLNTLEELAGWPDLRRTGVDEILIVPITLGGDDEGTIYGRSDYADIIGLQGELNNRVTQEGEILDKHADPWLSGPPSMLDEKGAIDNKNRYINVEAGDQEPAYLVWDGQLMAVNQQIVRLINHIILTAGLSPESFQVDTAGGAESGRALRMRQHRTADAVEMRQIVYGEALRRVISIASKLGGVRGDAPDGAAQVRALLEPQDINIEWPDGLPADPLEEIERTTLEVQGKLLSRRTAIENLHSDWTQERIDQELAHIDGEKQSGERRIGLGAGIEPVEGNG